ncbi:hypothetical protein QVD99_001665 [Batrachochytrium dendrobatidis]|nr:hypothetical protein O5D80_000315 [Batrachochytrium dendrobatidis]KAK5671834.1 hypothetical protein QVD99_001665 [Batrachochytrium dendrobatidis]
MKLTLFSLMCTVLFSMAMPIYPPSSQQSKTLSASPDSTDQSSSIAPGPTGEPKKQSPYNAGADSKQVSSWADGLTHRVDRGINSAQELLDKLERDLERMTRTMDQEIEAEESSLKGYGLGWLNSKSEDEETDVLVDKQA